MKMKLGYVMLIFLLSLGFSSKASLQLPEALFSTDGKYSLIYSYDSLNMVPVDAWSLYLNTTNEELAIIIPRNDSVYFVSYIIDRVYFPYYVTEQGDTLKCKVVNMMPLKRFLEQYQFTVTPLELARKIKFQIDTFKYKTVQAPYPDSIDQYRFTFSFYIDTFLLHRDTITTNLDSTVYVAMEYPNPFEQSRLYYDPRTNFYWLRSSIYSESLGFKEERIMTDTVIVSDYKAGLTQKSSFGRLPFEQY